MQANQVEVNQLDFISFEEEAVSESENEIEIVEKQKEITNETTAQTYKQTTQTYKQTAQSYQPTTQNYQAFHPIETLALAADSMDSLQEMMDQEDEYLSYDPLTPLPINPWVPSGRIYSKNMLTFLDEEISDFVQFVEPTPAEHAMRLYTLDRLRIQLVQLWPDAKLACFGSFETKLYLPSSDLDCVVIHSSIQTPGCLFSLKSQLESAKIAQGRVEALANAKVPILKYLDAVTGFRIDVSFNTLNGIEAAQVVKRFIEDEKIGKITRILMFVLKQFLVQRNLNEVFTGGISSYSLLCMIVSFLKMHPKLQTGEIDPMKNLGLLLIEFFELYGKWYSNESLTLNVTPMPTYTRRTQTQSFGFGRRGRPTALSIQDPQDSSNDISVGSYNYAMVKSSFMHAFTLLTAMIGTSHDRTTATTDTIKKSTTWTVKSGDRTMVSVLGSILTIDKNVMELRDVSERLYEEIIVNNGGVVDVGVDNIKTVKKKVQGAAVDVVFVEDDTEDQESVTEDEDEEEEDGEEEDEGDITNFYKMNNGKLSQDELEMLHQEERHLNKKRRI